MSITIIEYMHFSTACNTSEGANSFVPLAVLFLTYYRHLPRKIYWVGMITVEFVTRLIIFVEIQSLDQMPSTSSHEWDWQRVINLAGKLPKRLLIITP